MFDEIKQVPVEKDIECPSCMECLIAGSVMYKDEYRNEYFCPHCEEEYKEDVIRDEGEHGELLK